MLCGMQVRISNWHSAVERTPAGPFLLVLTSTYYVAFYKFLTLPKLQYPYLELNNGAG